MKIWIAGTVAEVKETAKDGIADAIVTNPTVIADWLKEDGDIRSIAKDVVEYTNLPLYIQLKGPTKKDFLNEYNYFNKVSDLILPKLPATKDGITTAKEMEMGRINTLVTAVSSISQAYACAVAGVTTICPYFNRLKEGGIDVIRFIQNIRTLYSANTIETSLMLASIRSVEDSEEAILAGANGAIVFDEVYKNLFQNELSSRLLQSFEKDWQKIRII